MRIVLFMTLLLAGIPCLVAGMFVTRQTWRPDIAPFGRGSRMFHIALHPERFATPERLQVIRILNLAGLAFIVGALGVVAYDIASAFHLASP